MKLLRRFFYVLFGLVAVVIVAVLGIRWWVVGTESGTGFALRQVQGIMGDSLTIGEAQGSLGDGLSLQNIRYQAEGTEVQLASARVAVAVNLLPRPNVIIRRLQLDDLQVQLQQTEPSAQPAAKFEPPSIGSPVPIMLQDVRINNARFITGSDAEPIVLNRLSARINYADSLTIEQLSIDGSGIQAQASGSSELSPPYMHQLTMNIDNQAAPWVPELQGLQSDIKLDGSLNELNVAITTRGPIAVSMDAVLQDLLDEPRWEISAHNRQSNGEFSSNSSATALIWPPAATGQPAQAIIEDFTLTSSGSLQDYRADLNASVDTPTAIGGQWQLGLLGNQQKLVIEQLAGPVLQGRIEGNGEYALQSDPPEATLALQISDIKPATDQPELADLPGISGSLNLRLNDQIASLEQLNLRVPDTDWRVTGNAGYQLQSEQVSADINWQQLSWPPQSGSQAQFASQQGHIRASGKLSDLQISVATDVSGQSLPDSSLKLQGQLLEQRFRLADLTLQTLDGELAANGLVQWQDGVSWELAINTEQINPGVHWNQFPGAINLQAASTGSQSGDQLEALLTIQQLDGSLRGKPLSGSGEVRFADGSIRTDGLQLRSGEAQLNLQGDDRELELSLNIPRIQDLLPETRGSLQGTVSGQSDNNEPLGTDNLQLALDFTGSKLAWSGYRIETLNLTSQSALGSKALMSDTELTLAALQLPDRGPIERVALTFDSDRQQQLEVQVVHPETSLNLQLDGEWDQWPAPQSWQGQVQTLSVNNQQTGEWSLQQAAKLALIPGDITLEPMCVQSARQQTSNDQRPGICVQFRQQPGNHAELDLQSLPVAMFDAFLNIGMRSDHLLSGSLIAGWGDQLEQLDGEFNLSDGELSFLARNTPPLQVSGAQLQLQLTDQQHIRSQLQLAIESGNSINGDLLFGPLSAEQPQLDGTLELSMPDLGWLRKIMPELDRIGGSLDTKATFSGPMRQPLVALDIELKDGAVVYQPIGLQLIDLELSGHSEPGQVLDLTGGFTGGEGRANLQASLNPSTRKATLELTGENVQLLNSEAIKVRISPDVRVSASPEGYQIDGTLAIPAALLTPPEGATSRVSESDDVVLVGVEQPEQEPPESFPLTGQLKLVLGKAVQVDADIAKTNLTGELDLSWDNTIVPIADGVIRLTDGQVEAYSAKLSLLKSRVIYNNGPADNPRLDITAARRIFGDPRVFEAGVAITGTAQQPDIRVFTDPATNSESALAYIATGSDFDNAGGSGALNLGLYIFPKLFVSYGLGLFDNGNTASARYEFSRNFDVSVQSGAADTGVDINWRKDG